MDILHSTTFWVAIAFVLFWGLIWYKGRGAILGGLDKNIKVIKDEIEEAAALRKEARDNLADAKVKLDEAEQNCLEITQMAHEELKYLKEQSHKRFNDYLVRREQQVQDRIFQMEQTALKTIKNELADAAMDKATAELISTLANRKTDPLISANINHIHGLK